MTTEFWARSFDQADCYYQVGNQKTYNRNVAIGWANGDVDKIHLYWLDDIWSSIDLSKRPTRSWNQLMKERCYQIRDKALQVGIAFSGGFDSQTILDHFVLNNIRIDYLQINHKKYCPHLESYSAFDTATKTKQQYYPDLKIDVIDVDIDYMLNIYKNNKEDWLWVAGQPGEFRFTKMARTSLVNCNYQHSTAMLRHDRLTIEGHEKPRLFIEDEWWVMAMLDSVLCPVFNTPFENFYISPDLPELHLKQVWMMIDWLESQSLNSVKDLEAFLHQVQSSADNKINQQWNRAIGRNNVRHANSLDLIITTKHDTCGGLYSCGTIDFFNDHPVIKSSTEFKIWESAALEFYKTYPTAFVTPNETSGDAVKNIEFAKGKNIWTKKYRIKPVELGKIVNNV
jgi:hypothetical protein